MATSQQPMTTREDRRSGMWIVALLIAAALLAYGVYASYNNDNGTMNTNGVGGAAVTSPATAPNDANGTVRNNNVQ